MNTARKPWPTFRQVLISLLTLDAAIPTVVWLALKLTAI